MLGPVEAKQGGFGGIRVHLMEVQLPPRLRSSSFVHISLFLGKNHSLALAQCPFLDGLMALM